jgi:hypothetical protein
VPVHARNVVPFKIESHGLVELDSFIECRLAGVFHVTPSVELAMFSFPSVPVHPRKRLVASQAKVGGLSLVSPRVVLGQTIGPNAYTAVISNLAEALTRDNANPG